jgi:YVTN family beta-propeller protein
MAVSPDGRWVICTSESASLVHFIDADSARLVDSVLVGTRPRDAQFSADGRQLWVSSETRATVTVFSMPDRKRLHTIDFDSDDRAPDTVQAVGIVLAPTRAFIALGRGNAVAEVDPVTFAIRRYFPVGQRNWGIGLSPDRKHLYAANGLSGNVTVIDLVANRPMATIAVSGKPWGVVVLPRSGGYPHCWCSRARARRQASCGSAPIRTTCRSPTSGAKASRTASPSWSRGR